MKTVRKTLNEMDIDRLINAYLYNHPIEYEKEDRLGMEINQIIHHHKAVLRRYIERLQKMRIKKPADAHQGILYVHRYIKEYFHEEAYCLIHADELLEKGADCNDYAYEFTPQAEIIGFLIADNPLTQYHIYDLMADVLFEASFFGFEQQYLKEELDKLIKAEEEIKSGKAKTIPFDDVIAELEAKGRVFDRETKEEEELRKKAMEAANAYSQYSRKMELDMIRETLMKGAAKA